MPDILSFNCRRVVLAGITGYTASKAKQNDTAVHQTKMPLCKLTVAL